MSDGRWQDEVLGFWLSLERDEWFQENADFDAECRERFLELWNAERDKPASEFLASAEDALAAVILFDQLPRNMFRGHADGFSTDPLALEVAKVAIDKGYDHAVPADWRVFFYMPFEHSESLEEQRRSVALFTELGDTEFLRFAKLHHDVIARFGRFPHRNAILGREPRADEIAAGDVTPF